MWVITQYLTGKIAMYECNTEQEARDLFQDIKGNNKILTEVIYYNDPVIKR